MGPARGSYLLADHEGPYAVERFTCGPDGDGWTYTATRHEPRSGRTTGRLCLRLDAAGVTTRLHVEGGGWVLRGGCVGAHVLWRRGEQEHEQVASGFSGTSPAYALAAVQRTALAVGEQRRLRLVAVTEPVLATRVVDQGWSRPAPDRWDAVDLATGERSSVRWEDGVLVEGTGLTLTRD